MDEDLEDIRRLSEIIQAEGKNVQNEDDDCFLIEFSSEDEEEDAPYIDYESEAESEDEFLVQDEDIADEEETASDIIIAQESITLKDIQNDIHILTPYLNYDEYNIICKCKDPKLKNLLILNRFKKLQLKMLHQRYQGLMAECNKGLAYENNIKKKLHEISKGIFSSLNSGYPYFRKRKEVPCPSNSDTEKRLQSYLPGYPYEVDRLVWTLSRQLRLKNEILINFYNNVLDEYEYKLKITRDPNQSEVWLEKVNDWRNKVAEEEVPELWCDRYIDWNHIALLRCGDAGCANACKAFWNLYVHPSINKDPFSVHENERIIELAREHNEQNWELIAEKLENNRSPFLVCVYFFTKLKARIDYFSKEEDEMLQQLIEKYRKGNYIPWSKLSCFMQSKSKNQIYHRYRYALTATLSSKKRGPFSKNEDLLIVCLVKKYGEDYKKISDHFPTRTPIQIRNRYRAYLQRNATVTLGSYTVLDDEQILDHVRENGSRKWNELGEKLNRTSSHVRHRYGVIMRHFAKNADTTLADLPRRALPKWQEEIKKRSMLKTSSSLAYYLNTNTLPSIEESESVNTRKGGGSSGRPRRSHLDLELINYFTYTAQLKKAPKLKWVTEEIYDKCAESIQTVFDILGVNLNIPDDPTHKSLDSNDLELLSRLKRMPKRDLTDQYVPPNLSTIQALRCILLQYQDYKQVHEVATYDEPQTPESQRDLDVFKERFMTLFRWPCVMSLKKPNENEPIQLETNEQLAGVKQAALMDVPVQWKKGTNKVQPSASSTSTTAVPPVKRVPVKTEFAPPPQIKTSNPAPAAKVTVQPIRLIKRLPPNADTSHLIRVDKATMERLKSRMIMVKKAGAVSAPLAKKIKLEQSSTSTQPDDR